MFFLSKDIASSDVMGKCCVDSNSRGINKLLLSQRDLASSD